MLVQDPNGILKADRETLLALAGEGKLARYTGQWYGMHGQLVRLNKPILDDYDQPTGAWDVYPHLPEEGRFSWISCDADEGELVAVTPDDLSTNEN